LGVLGQALRYYPMRLCELEDLGKVSYMKVLGGTDHAPFVLEVAFGIQKVDDIDRDEDGEPVEEPIDRAISIGINWSPVLGHAIPFRQLADLLGEYRLDPDDPIYLAVHLVCPNLRTTDRGKTVYAIPHEVEQALAACMKKCCDKWRIAKLKKERLDKRELERLRKEESPDRDRRKRACYQVMEAAYNEVSDHGALPANARQIMYAVRRMVLALINEFYKKSSSFTQKILPDFVAEHPDLTAGWDVTFDARGHFAEPHTRHRIGLGTLEAREYIAGWHSECDEGLEEITIAQSLPTRGPGNRFHFALFIEKEGFDSLIKAARLEERYDIAVFSTKGMSTTAARLLVEELSKAGVTILVLHDFDYSGMGILHTIRNNTRRYTFADRPKVIDIGLRLKDCLAMGLESEPFEFPARLKKDPRENLERYGATKEEIKFLVTSKAPPWKGDRVELNSMVSRVWIDYVERKSIRLEPHRPAAYTNLGGSLDSQGRYPEAEAALREALRLQPDWVPALVNLGVTLYNQGRYPEAEATLREALRLQPNFFKAHLNLGAALCNQGRCSEAEAAFREAFRLEPDSPHTYCNLGVALHKQGRLAEALACLRRGDELGRKLPGWSFPSADWVRDCERLVELDDRRAGLLRGETAGVSAADLIDYAVYRHSCGELAEAVALLRQTVALQTDLADAPGQTHLPVLAAQTLVSPTTPGLASVTTQLLISKRFQDVFALADAHGDLSWLLSGQGKWQESAVAARQAILLRPGVGWYHNNLGSSLQQLGRLEEAVAEYREALKLDPAYKLAQANLKNLEAMLALVPRLDAVRRGEACPGGPDECVKLAELCRLKKLYRTATHLFADAFAAAPKLADDLDQAHRYNAACSATLAATGQAVDAGNVPDEVASLLRRQALRWLRADLALRALMAGGNNLAAKRTVREKLEFWQADAELASVRDSKALARLPGNERAAWQALWRDVDELAKGVAKKDKPTNGRNEPETPKAKP
jgi:tetratricopeptide (TPR) repeat protein